MRHDNPKVTATQAPRMDAWDCPCGTANLPTALKCRRCLRPSTNARIRLFNQQGMVRALAREQSFTLAARIVPFLYLAGFLPGLCANRHYLAEGERVERLAGRELPGVQRLRQLWLTGRPVFALLHTVVLLLVGMTLWGFQSQRPAPIRQTQPALSAPVAPHYRAWPTTPRVTIRRAAPRQQVVSMPSRATYALPVRQPAVAVWTPPPAEPSERAEPVVEAPEEPRWTRQRAAVWEEPRVVPDVSGSFDPPIPEQAPEPVARPRAPIQLYGTRAYQQPPISVAPLRAPQVAPLTWRPQTRFPGFRR